ncbi:MAG: hypothetical protein ACM3JB_02635 [Acidobacteriaceae bacterium]
MKREEDIAELFDRLRDLHAADREARLGDAFLPWIEDPLKPRTDSGKFRFNRILLFLAALAMLAAATFLFFSEIQL